MNGTQKIRCNRQLKTAVLGARDSASRVSGPLQCLIREHSVVNIPNWHIQMLEQTIEACQESIEHLKKYQVVEPAPLC